MAGMIQVHKPRVWLLLFGAVATLWGVKTIQSSFLTVGPTLILAGQPALLFFNNEEGCDCVLPLYARADEVIAAWLPEQRAQVDVDRIILDERPDLAQHYNVERAPMLLLLDTNDHVVWREWGVASNPDVFDLPVVEEQIHLLVGAAENDLGNWCARIVHSWRNFQMSGIPSREPCCLPRAKGLSYLKVGPRESVVGMMVLETVFKQLMVLQQLPEDVSDAEIIGMARKSNYIPNHPDTEANYAAALQEAYVRFYDRATAGS